MKLGPRIGIILAVILGCDNPDDPLSGQPPVNPLDTLEQVVAEGIVLRLTGFEHTYGLDDTCEGTLSVINFGSSQPLILYLPSVPEYSWNISNLENPTHRFYWPTFVQPSVWRDTLDIGDTLSFNFRWIPWTFYPYDLPWNVLDAFSGNYELRVSLGGNELFRNRALTKFIHISERGQPLSSLLSRMGGPDSLNADFVVRNRVLSRFELPIDDPTPLNIYFVDDADTLINLEYSVPFSVLSLPPQSDNVVFQFRAAKTDSMLDNIRLRGVYMSAMLSVRGRDFVPQETFVFIP